MSTPSSRRLRGRREESNRTEGIEFGGSESNSSEAPSSTVIEHSAPLESVVARLETQMARTPRTFTPEALETMRERESQYLDELGTEGIRQARRSRSDVVSAADIERADSLIRVSGDSTRATVLDTAGGVLAGAGLGQLIDVLSQADPSVTGVAISTGCLVPGIALVTLGLARRLHR